MIDQLNRYIEGKCMQMCPNHEITTRIREKCYHILETNNHSKPDKSKMVKEFSRSAAGKQMMDPFNLRPPNVLLGTLKYLLNEVLKRDKYSFLLRYDFITDRLRSIRQDMIIQNLDAAHCVGILQPCVKFHAYAAYRLGPEKRDKFDPHLNNTLLQECLKLLLCCYDELERTGCENEELLEKRTEFEAVYIIFNIGSSTALRRALNLPKYLKDDEDVKKAILSALLYSKNNFYRFCKIIITLQPLLAALASLHLPQLRKKLLQIMSVAYSSKNNSFPINDLTNILLYSTENELQDDLKCLNIPFENDKINFQKSTVISNEIQLPVRHEKFAKDLMDNISPSKLILS